MVEWNELSEADIRKFSKRMYYGGFLLLPWLWLVNYVYFRKILTYPNCPSDVRKYVVRSLYLWVVCFLFGWIWYITYLVNRKAWGQFGHDFSVVDP